MHPDAGYFVTRKCNQNFSHRLHISVNQPQTLCPGRIATGFNLANPKNLRSQIMPGALSNPQKSILNLNPTLRNLGISSFGKIPVYFHALLLLVGIISCSLYRHAISGFISIVRSFIWAFSPAYECSPPRVG